MYNGWKNKETWLVHLWLTSDETVFAEVDRIIAEASNRGIAADKLYALVDNLIPIINEKPGLLLYYDLAMAALSHVDWLDLATILEGGQ